MICHSKMDPKTTQDQAKTAPRRSQRPSFFIVIFVFDFGPFGAPFRSSFGTLLDPKIGSKSIQEVSKLCWGDRPPLDHPRRPQDPPKDSQEAPRGAQDASKRPPGGPHETLRRPSKPLRCPLEASKFNPKGSKGHQEDPQ